MQIGNGGVADDHDMPVSRNRAQQLICGAEQVWSDHNVIGPIAEPNSQRLYGLHKHGPNLSMALFYRQIAVKNM